MMDTSKKYIKMCEKAEEIQSDKVCLKYGKSYKCIPSLFANIGSYSFSTFYQYKHKDNIWLPRQDQLQEMMDEWYKNNPHALISDFHDSIYEEPMPSYYVPKNFNSMEQLWLAFVMKEKYSKEWINGKEWVK